jgi:DNA-binding MarR family transcriptional regulator
MALRTTMDAIEALPIFSAARRDDPATSHKAAAAVPAIRGDHARRILEALAAGPAGQTAIAERSGLTVAQVSKRIHELRRKWLIEKTGREVARGEDEYRRSNQHT